MTSRAVHQRKRQWNSQENADPRLKKPRTSGGVPYSGQIPPSGWNRSSGWSAQEEANSSWPNSPLYDAECMPKANYNDHPMALWETYAQFYENMQVMPSQSYPQWSPMPTPRDSGLSQSWYHTTPLNRNTPAVGPFNNAQTIPIDGVQREVLFYGEQAIVMLACNDPRSISFMPGQHRVFIDNVAVTCSIGCGYVDFVLDGRVHKVKIGAPTREVYIDDQWFPCTFGAQPISVPIGGRYVQLSLEGPAPAVNIGPARNSSRVASTLSNVAKKQNVRRAPNGRVSKPFSHDTAKPSPNEKNKERDEMVRKLHQGKPCATCGLRFYGEKEKELSAHYDWHFRLARRTKSIKNRGWYVSKQHWILFSEIEAPDGLPTTLLELNPSVAAVPAQTLVTKKHEGKEYPCVAAGVSPEDNKCQLCLEDIDKFFNREEDEWWLRNAVRVNGRTFHSTCYTDQPAVLK